jgi:hypothetical protein
MHPYINRPAKGALRWYTDLNQITRHSRACKDDSQLCPFALHWPSWQILPFQFASFDGPFLATAWGLYDMNGNLAYDLSEYIEVLTMDSVTAPGPERVVVTSDAPILLDYIMAQGLYEMRITAVGGKTYYSETIHVQCGPCMVADGIYGEDTLVEGSRYLYTDGRVATYCGLECETPVDENGFNSFDACVGGIALVVSESKWGEYTWDGTEWLASFEMPCFHKLEWRDCGDVGTQLYKENGYSNIVYLKEADATISEPAVVWNEERDKDVNGGETVSQARKDVEWNIKTRMAWFLFDAITETPLMDEVRLRAAFALGSDLLGNIRFEYQWDGPCMIDVTMTFRLGDDSSSTGCCDKYDRIPQESCLCDEAMPSVSGAIAHPSLNVEYSTYLGFSDGRPVYAAGEDGEILMLYVSDPLIPGWIMIDSSQDPAVGYYSPSEALYACEVTEWYPITLGSDLPPTGEPEILQICGGAACGEPEQLGGAIATNEPEPGFNTYYQTMLPTEQFVFGDSWVVLNGVIIPITPTLDIYGNPVFSYSAPDDQEISLHVENLLDADCPYVNRWGPI